MDLPRGQGNGEDIEMGDGESDEQLQNQPQQTPGSLQIQQQSAPSSHQLSVHNLPAGPLPIPSYENAILWQQTPVDDHRLTLYASQHFGSYERVNDSAFYLNNDDSRPLYNHVFFDDPVNFPLTPGPVPMFNRPNEPPGGTQSTSGMGQQPGRRMPARRGVSGRGRLSTQENRSPMRTQDRLNAEVWSDPPGFIRSRYDAARNLPSRQDGDDGSFEFYLAAEDSNALRAIIQRDPDRYPGPPSETVSSRNRESQPSRPRPRGGRGRGHGRGRGRGRGRSRGRGQGQRRGRGGGRGGRGQDPVGQSQPAGYVGAAEHGTPEQYQYAIRNGYPPEQFGLYYEGEWVGPPIEQVNQEISEISWQDPESEADEGETAKSTPNWTRETIPTRKGRKDAPFDGLLDDHYDWWGSFIDDGPVKDGETIRNARIRKSKARFNMQIQSRGKRPVAPWIPELTVVERRKERDDFSREVNKAIRIHNHKMDSRHSDFDEEYVTRWRTMKTTRKTNNDARRLQELTHVRAEYARRGLSRPLTPEPAEDSGDEDALYDDLKIRQRRGGDEDSGDGDGDTEQRWDADPVRFAKYRAVYRDREQLRCENCKNRRQRCTSNERPFPCDRCIERGVPCVRQPWNEAETEPGGLGRQPSQAPQLYIPSLYVRQQLGAAAPASWRIGDPDPPTRATGTTAVPPLMPPTPSNAALAALEQSFEARAAQAHAAAAAANSAAPTPPHQPVLRCRRCVIWGLPCHKTRPCWNCIQAGEMDSCDTQIQSQPFGENAPGVGEDYVMQELPNEYDYSRVDPLLLNLGGHPTGDGIEPHLLGVAPDNLFESFNAGPLPFRPVPSSGHQVGPAGPTPGPHLDQAHVPDAGWKRALSEDDDDAYEDPRSPKRLRGTNPFTEASELARAIGDSQPSVYDPSGNTVADTEDDINFGDFLIDDIDDDGLPSPPQPATPRGPTVPVYSAPAWQLFGLPSKPPSGGRSNGPDNYSKECKENRNHWKGIEWNNCRRAPAKDCEHIMDNQTCSCRPCNDDQDRNMEPNEADTIKMSKLYCCADCDQLVRTAVDEGIPEVQKENCFCSWQLNQTWICNYHRQNAHDDLKRRVGINKQTYITQNPVIVAGDGSFNLCPGCKKVSAGWGSTWQCVACETYVVKNLMMA